LLSCEADWLGGASPLGDSEVLLLPGSGAWLAPDSGAWLAPDPGAKAAEGLFESGAELADVSGASAVAAGAVEECGVAVAGLCVDSVAGTRSAVVGSDSLGSAGLTLVTGGANAGDDGWGACVLGSGSTAGAGACV
jgi:hypothetical protein